MHFLRHTGLYTYRTIYRKACRKGSCCCCLQRHRPRTDSTRTTAARQWCSFTREGESARPRLQRIPQASTSCRLPCRHRQEQAAEPPTRTAKCGEVASRDCCYCCYQSPRPRTASLYTTAARQWRSLTREGESARLRLQRRQQASTFCRLPCHHRQE